MALLTDWTICPIFDQAKKNEQNLEKINSRKDPMNKFLSHIFMSDKKLRVTFRIGIFFYVFIFDSLCS